MFLLMLSRTGFYVFNHRMFPDMNLLEFFATLRGGMVFDISAVVYFNMLFILLEIVPIDIRYNQTYEKVVKYLFFVINGLMLSMNGADYVYYRFVNKRATADVFGTFENEANLSKLFFKFMVDYWPATLFTLFLIALMVYLYGKLKVTRPEPRNRYVYFGINFIVIPIVLILVVGAARGGYRHSTRPITISNAARYVSDPRNVPIVLNTPFSILRTFGKKELVKYDFFDEDSLKGLYDPLYIPQNKGQFKPYNIVILILESFSREYVGFFNKDLEGGTYKGYTPFLDSLLSVSLTFDVSLANGNKSIDAMPSILASMPSLETPYIISYYANDKINGLPSLLKSKGYYSAFFHGAANGSMGFDSFSSMAGFDGYFGMNEYGNDADYDGMWGIWDIPFLNFFADKLDEFRKPFIASLFTLSSHHPFRVPPEYEGKFRKGPIPICETIGYSDYALRLFFREMEKKPWFDSTLFVLTADHTNEKIHKEFENSYGQFSIPILFYMHNSNLKGIKKRIAQQIDIMPTILNYLNYDSAYIAFGNNLLDDTTESFGFNTFGSSYYIFMHDHVLEMIDNKSVALYDYKKDRFQKDNLVGEDPYLQIRMENKLKAIIQTYNQRLIDDDLTVKKEGEIYLRPTNAWLRLVGQGYGGQGKR
jgi:phosphoglycerol transferase MdoB-like AlkP superfamily enzyme